MRQLSVCGSKCLLHAKRQADSDLKAARSPIKILMSKRLNTKERLLPFRTIFRADLRQISSRRVPRAAVNRGIVPVAIKPSTLHGSKLSDTIIFIMKRNPPLVRKPAGKHTIPVPAAITQRIGKYLLPVIRVRRRWKKTAKKQRVAKKDTTI